MFFQIRGTEYSREKQSHLKPEMDEKTERKREYDARYYSENRVAIVERRAAYRANNREVIAKKKLNIMLRTVKLYLNERLSTTLRTTI